jgi:SAM-dependent methyltransferase/SOS-response transcriptional repressor LexA
MHEQTLKHYDKHAEAFSTQYRAAEPEALHKLLMRWLPSSGSVLEVGCGSGRDAAFMAGLGLNVVATDGSAGMLDQARLQASTLSAETVSRLSFQHATFPLPSGHPLLAEHFDAIVAVAILMHIPNPSFFDFAFQIRSLLKPRGRFICSFCAGRESAESDPRLYVNREPGEVRLIFERLGFVVLAQEDTEDSLKRGIRWTTLVFGCEHATGNRPVDQIEAVINHDKKDATYKLALLRALCDISQSAYRHARWHPDGTVSVPLGLVSEKWLYYYWPLIDTGDEPIIPQKRGMEINKPIAFRKALTALASHFHAQNGLSRFHGEFQNGRLDPIARQLTDAALNSIANTIVVGPVKFASQGGFAFEGSKQAAKKCHSPQSLYASLGRIHFDAEVWRELSLVGHWIGEAIILRWAELTVEISRKEVSLTRVLDKLLMRPETDRDVFDARAIYKTQSELICVWTKTVLTEQPFAVDHAIPFSLWHNNDLWNLLPADAKANNEKRDRLVSREALLSSREVIIDCWQKMHHAMPARFDIELNRTLFGRNHAEAQWESPAFSAFAEAVETVAIQRGVERWSPKKQGVVLPARNTSYYPEIKGEQMQMDRADSQPAYYPLKAEQSLIAQEDVPKRAFVDALPIVGRIAASTTFFDGFLTGSISDVTELDWVAVPRHLCKPKRFVIRVAGDSMEPLFQVGELLVFDYHRTPRQDGQIVIASDFTSGSGEYAVKRYKEHTTFWRFLSENTAYDPVEIRKTEMPFPILGTFVAKLDSGSAL